MTIPCPSSARARKRRARPSAPTTAPTRRCGKRLCSSSLLSPRIRGCGNSKTPRRFTPTPHLRRFFLLLQAGCTGYHALDLMALHNEIQLYHLEVEGIPGYINIIEDAQKQVGLSVQTIANETILLFTRERRYSQLSATPGPTMAGRIERRTQKPGPTGRPATRRRTLRRASKHKPSKGLTSLAPRMQQSGSSRTAK